MGFIAYIDPFSGISGDMTVAALADAGAEEAILKGLKGLNLPAEYSFSETYRQGIRARYFHVKVHEEQGHRHLKDIQKLLERADLPEPVRARASRIFERIGEVEARIHGLSIDKVHFHEVGAIDSIADVVGACLGFQALGIEAVVAAPVNVGRGWVKVAHGRLPVPAPATAELLKGVPIYSEGPEAELTTPTGAAILAEYCREFGPLPHLRLSKIGYGAGTKDFPGHPNVLRILIGERIQLPEAEVVSTLETNIDDSSPELVGYTVERLFEAGALDVWLTPICGKKNRPAVNVHVLVPAGEEHRFAQLLFRETTTLGVRFSRWQRWVRPREHVTVSTRWGPVRIKVAGEGFAPEYEDCRELARKFGVPLKSIYLEAQKAYLEKKNQQ